MAKALHGVNFRIAFVLVVRSGRSDSTDLARTEGRVAQLVRALLSHSRGPGFESLRDHARCFVAIGEMSTPIQFTR